jgi:hypothetical protein
MKSTKTIEKNNNKKKEKEKNKESKTHWITIAIHSAMGCR